jgi:glutamate-1-semialdehyde aminotransferase
MSQSLFSKGVIMPALTTSSLSTAMTEDDIDFLLAAIGEFFDSDIVNRVIE